MADVSAGSSQETAISDANNERQEVQTAVFFGKTGDGKSTLCNMLLSSEVEGELVTGTNFGSVSQEVVTKSNENSTWRVIDTVGLGDALKDTETATRDALQKVWTFFSAERLEVDHICYVMRKGEFTKYEKVYWQCFMEIFGADQFKNHIRLIFTSAGEKWLLANQKDIKDLIGNYPMISVDFPPTADVDDAGEEDILRRRREKNLRKLQKFFSDLKHDTGDPVTIVQETSSRVEDRSNNPKSSSKTEKEGSHKKKSSGSKGSSAGSKSSSAGSKTSSFGRKHH